MNHSRRLPQINLPSPAFVCTNYNMKLFILPVILLTRFCSFGMAAEGMNKDIHSPVSAPFINTWMVGDACAATLTSVASRSCYFDDRLFSRNYDDYQDLRSYFGWIRKEKTAGIAVTASTGIWSPSVRNAQLWLGADRECLATLNGQSVGQSDKAAPDRDMLKWDITLKQGWNELQLRIANRDENYLGFYARIADKNGSGVPGLILSPEGGTGDLRVTTRAITGTRAQDNPLPTAWREWPYVGLNPFPGMYKPRNVHASPFLLTAAGGKPPYQWKLLSGKLPPGLLLHANGEISGTVTAVARLDKYAFAAEVTDAAGTAVRHDLWMEVRERPNKAIEEARLLGLVHRPEHTPESGCDPFVEQMKRQGYQVVMPVSCNCGPEFYNWDTQVLPKPHNFKNLPEYGDVISQYKQSAEKYGLRFGLYVGGFPRPNIAATPGGMVRIFEELTEKFQPAVLYFDWASNRPESVDAAFSAIRARDPEAVIQVNQAQTGRRDNGDWDQVSYEGWGAWGKGAWGGFPGKMNWPKTTVMDTWRLLPDPDYESTRGLDCDTDEIIRVMVSIICEGNTCNLDCSTVASRKNGHVSDRLLRWEDSCSFRDHEKIAVWANPKDADGKPLPPLCESYTYINPLPQSAADWGYSVINTRKDAIYLHVLQNPRGKKGMPPDGKITARKVLEKIAVVTCMNTGKPVPFTQTGDTVTIDAKTVTPDPVDTIFKLAVER